MEFLVEIEAAFSPNGDPTQKAELIAAEGRRAKEFAAEGIVRRLWRQPGRWANFNAWKSAGYHKAA